MKTVIFGNSAMAKVVFSYAREIWDIAGFTIDDVYMKEGEDSYCGLPLVGFSQVEKVFSPLEHNMILPIGFIDMNELRKARSREAREKGYKLASYIHSDFKLHYDVEVGENAVILDCVSVHPGTKIGDNVFISSNVNIGHDCTIEDGNWINSGVSIAGSTVLGEGCFLGVNASVGNGLTIGKRNFIGAGTFQGKSTGDGEVHFSGTTEKFPMDSRKFLRFAKVLG